MLLIYLQALGGLILLVVAGDLLVRGAVSMSQRLGVPTLIIGLTVVAFGTSAPELFVGIKSVVSGHATIALGNVVGSNIANVLLVIGIPAMMAPMMCDAQRLVSNTVIMLAATAVLLAFAMTGAITATHGAVLVALLGGFLIYSGTRARKSARAIDELAEIGDDPDSSLLSIVLLIGGLAGLAVGAQMLINSSVEIALQLGVKEEVIGLTLVAVGTSLPELVTSVAASLRRECDVAVGNIIGSNIFNLLGILGISSIVGPIPVPQSFLMFDLWVMAGTSLLILPYCLFRLPIGRISGILFTGGYAFYIWHLMQHGERMKHMMGG